jgi:hypothetical protein
MLLNSSSIKSERDRAMIRRRARNPIGPFYKELFVFSILRVALPAVAVVFGVAARAQLAIPPDTNLFGDEIGRKIPSGNGVAPEAAHPAKGWSHLLIFQDHRQLRGEVVSMGKEEIVFRCPGASEPLRFARRAVRRIFFDEETASEWGAEPFVSKRVVRDNGVPPMFATVQLAGADWLFGELTSADGQTFTLKLDDHTAFSVRRADIEFLYFARSPAPASGFTGNVADLEGWTGPATLDGIRADAGVVSESGREWLERCCGGAPKLEVDLTVPESAEEGTRIWLQPRRIEPNLYTEGTVEMDLGAENVRLCQVSAGMQENHSTISFPDEAKGGS